MKLYNEIEIKLLREHYPIGGTDRVQKFINRSSDSIRHKAKSLLIKVNDDFKLSKINLDDLIDPVTPQSAYVLGILWGDGTLHWNKLQRSYRISLTLIEDDFNDINELFARFHFSRIKKRKASWRQCICATICHKKFAQFLKDHDFLTKSKSSPTKILEVIPNQNKHYFFRGWFDADGSNNEIKKGKYTITISGSFGQDWESLEQICEKLNVKYKIYRMKWKTSKYSAFSVCGYNNIMRFFTYLYNGVSMGMSRKFKNFSNIRPPIRTKSLDA